MDNEEEKFKKCGKELMEVISKYYGENNAVKGLEFLTIFHSSFAAGLIKRDINERELEEALVHISRSLYLRIKSLYNEFKKVDI